MAHFRTLLPPALGRCPGKPAFSALGCALGEGPLHCVGCRFLWGRLPPKVLVFLSLRGLGVSETHKPKAGGSSRSFTGPQQQG